MEHFFKGMWGTFGINDGQFRNPWGIAVDSNDDTYVTDAWINGVQKFTRTGDFIRKWVNLVLVMVNLINQGRSQHFLPILYWL